MAEKHVDRRIQRTRQLLQDALFALIVERGYQQIAIQDITERANLGRTTFYLHYEDKDSLLQASLQSLMQALQISVELAEKEGEKDRYLYQTWSIRIFEHIAERPQLYQALFRETGPINMGDLMRRYFADYLQQNALLPLKESNALKTEILAAHAAGSLFGLIQWWLDHEEKPSAEQMGRLYFHLMAHGGEDIPL